MTMKIKSKKKTENNVDDCYYICYLFDEAIMTLERLQNEGEKKIELFSFLSVINMLLFLKGRNLH